MIGGVFTGKNTGSGGTANLTGCIASSEFHSLVGNPVDVGTLVKSRALIAKIPGSHIIHEDEDDIRPLGFHAKEAKHEEKGSGEEKSVEFHYVNLRKL